MQDLSEGDSGKPETSRAPQATKRQWQAGQGGTVSAVTSPERSKQKTCHGSGADEQVSTRAPIVCVRKYYRLTSGVMFASKIIYGHR